ncbi:MAG TPA: hypothetical protein DCF33_18830 [Saprospirales bacterium]|nr:hypothetical protein [Saprospirales bacterium]
MAFGQIHAQDPNSEEPEPGATITPDPAIAAMFQTNTVQTPLVKSSSVIVYSDGLSVEIEFMATAMTPTSVQLVNQSNTSEVSTLNVSGGKTSTQALTAGKVYNIRATGSNGQPYIIGTVNTRPFVAGEPVVVSEKLYRSLSEYVTPGNQITTLSNYLKQLSGVSQHEKISFLQRYAMNGAVLPASIKGQYPDSYVRHALKERQTEGECICNFVMNQVTVVSPDETGIMDFTIGPKTATSGPNFYNLASFWFRGITAQGPAKFQLLENTGQRAGRNRRTETWTIGNETISDNYVRIGYHLMCLGITELPAECDCEKTIRYDFGYSTKIEARTDVGGTLCVFQQDATARAQDWAVAVVTREKVNNVNDVQILQSGLGVATSTCEGGVPISAIVGALNIGVSVFQLIKSVKTGQINDAASQTKEIVDKVEEVLTPFLEAKDCNAAIVERPLLQGTATITFRPNDPMSFMVISGSSMEVSGLRCWSSRAIINSSFHLAGVVNGGAPNANTPHCCTNYFSNWAWASQSGDANSRKNAINGHLALNSPGGWQTVNGQPNPNGNSLNIPTAIGYAIGVNLPNGQQCEKVIPINNNPR